MEVFFLVGQHGSLGSPGLKRKREFWVQLSSSTSSPWLISWRVIITTPEMPAQRHLKLRLALGAEYDGRLPCSEEQAEVWRGETPWYMTQA